jgi:hypothetical protein
MPQRELTDLILALLHSVAHATTAAVIMVASATVAWSLPLCTTTTAFGHAMPSCIGEAPVPFPPPYQPMEPSDPNTSPWGRLGRSCAIHGWGACPNRVAPAHKPSSSNHQGEEEEEEEDDARRITVVTDPIGASVLCRTVQISIGPRGRP